MENVNVKIEDRDMLLQTVQCMLESDNFDQFYTYQDIANILSIIDKLTPKQWIAAVALKRAIDDLSRISDKHIKPCESCHRNRVTCFTMFYKGKLSNLIQFCLIPELDPCR